MSSPGQKADGQPHHRAIGHRDLVLDQSMIMSALDNALNGRAIRRDFARDPVSLAARTYLSLETLSLSRAGPRSQEC